MEDYQKLTSGKKAVIMDFSAPWCHPCKLVDPILADIANKYKGKLQVIHINIDDNKQLAQQMSVTEIPMMIMYKNGKALWTHIGVITKEDLEEKVKGGLK